MTKLDQRLEYVMANLSAAERAATFLRRWKEGKKPNRALTSMMPEVQQYEYSSLLSMARVANVELAFLFMAMEERATVLEVMHSHLVFEEAVRLVLLTVDETFRYGTEELATESEHANRSRKRRSAKGERSLRVRVVSDDDAERVSLSRSFRARADHALGLADECLGGFGSTPEESSQRTRHRARFLATLCQAWLELRCVELALEDLRNALLGEDPLAPQYRQMLDECRQRLEKVRESAEEIVGAIELPEPEEHHRKQAADLLKAG